MKKIAALALSFLLLATCSAVAQVNPWFQNGAALSPYDPTIGITVPSTVTGGNKGPGTGNFSNLYINGVAVQGFGNEPRNTALLGPVSGPDAPPSFRSIQNADLGNTSVTINTVACVPGIPCTITAASADLIAGTTAITGTTHANGLFYNSGNIFTNLASAENGVLVTDGSLVPSISTTLPNGIAMGTPASIVLTNATGLPNAGLLNSAMTIAGHLISLGGTQTIACSDLSNASTGCSNTVGTSGAAIPLLNGTNTWSGAQSFGNVATATTQAATDSSGKLATTLWAQVKGGCSPIEMFGGGASASDNTAALTAWQATFGSSPGQFCLSTGGGQFKVLTNGYTFNLAAGQSISFRSSGPEQTQWLFPNPGDGFVLNYTALGSAYVFGNAAFFENMALVTGATSTSCPFCSISGTTLTTANQSISAYANGTGGVFRLTMTTTTGMFNGMLTNVGGATGCSAGTPNGSLLPLVVIDNTHIELLGTAYSSGCTGGSVNATDFAAIGQLVVGASPGTKITGGSGTTWTVNNSQTLTARTLMLVGGGNAITINGASSGGNPMKPTTFSNLFFRGSDQLKLWNIGAQFNDTQNVTMLNPMYYGFNQDYTHGIMAQYNATISGQATNFVVINPFVTFANIGIDAEGYFQGVTVVGGGNLARVNIGLLCNAPSIQVEPSCNFSVGQVEAEQAAIQFNNIDGSTIGPALLYIGAQGNSNTATAVSMNNSPLNALTGLVITCNTFGGVTSAGMYLAAGSNSNSIGSSSFQGCNTALSIASGASGNHSTGITMFSNTANLVDAGTNNVIEYTDELNGTGDLLSSSLSVSFISAIPSGGSQSVGLNMTSTPHFGVFPGTGSPTMAAAQGSMYLRNDNGAAYINNNGSTGWTQLATSTGANPSATAGPTAINGSAATFMRSDAAPAIQKASSSQFGIVEVDNSTITASSGVISAVAATINGTSCTPGGSCTVAAAAGTLSGSTLASGITASSLTSVGTSLVVVTGGDSGSLGFGTITGGHYNAVSFNNAFGVSTIVGMFAGLTSDNSLYMAAPTGWTHHIRVNNLDVIQASGSAVTISQALTYGGVALGNSFTGSAGSSLVGSISPTFTGTLGAATIAATSTIKTGLYTVSSGTGNPALPSASSAGAGARAYVTDAVACTFLASLTGGGTTGCPVVSNGTSWQGG